jgi:hypothetical protein
MSAAGQKAVTKWMLVFSQPYAKGSDEYREQEQIKTLILAAAMGGAVIGAILGLIVGMVI